MMTIFVHVYVSRVDKVEHTKKEVSVKGRSDQLAMLENIKRTCLSFRSESGILFFLFPFVFFFLTNAMLIKEASGTRDVKYVQIGTHKTFINPFYLPLAFFNR